MPRAFAAMSRPFSHLLPACGGNAPLIEGRGYTGGAFRAAAMRALIILAFVLSHSGQNVNCQLIRVWVVAMKIEIDGTACREA